MRVRGCRGQHFHKFALPDVVRAGTGDQDPARAQHLQGPQVQLFVTAKRGLQGAAAARKGGGIEHDSVVLVTGEA